MEICSKLPKVPEPVQPDDVFFSLSFQFAGKVEESQMGIECSHGARIQELTRFWLPYRTQGAEWLRGHPAHLFLAVPDDSRASHLRLQVAVPYVEIEEMDNRKACEHRQDFDRLMDVVQFVLADMVEAGLLTVGKHVADIVAEPLTPTGRLKVKQVDYVAFAIGATWLTYKGQQIFCDYRKWDPKHGVWDEAG